MVIWRKSTAEAVIRLTMADGAWWYVLDLKRAVGVRWALVYRVLGSLEQAGEVEARWADLEPGREYRRRLYRLIPS